MSKETTQDRRGLKILDRYIKARKKDQQKEEAKAKQDEEKRLADLREFRPTRDVIEIEDKYLISPPPDEVLALATRILSIEVGYTPQDERIREERDWDSNIAPVWNDVKKIRRKGERRQVEQTEELSKEQYDARYALTPDARLIKTRYEIILGEYRVHLDQFHGVLEGRWMGEVEAESEEALDEFFANPPEYFKNSQGEIDRLYGERRNSFSSKRLARFGWPEEIGEIAI